MIRSSYCALALAVGLGLMVQPTMAQTPPPEPPHEPAAAVLAVPPSALPSSLPSSDLEPRPARAFNTPATAVADDLVVRPVSVEEGAGVQLDRGGDHVPASEAAVPAKLEPQSNELAREPVTPPGPAASAVRSWIEGLAVGATDEEKAERGAMLSFYNARVGEPIWFTSDGVTAKGLAVIDELKRANQWGLNANDFDLSGLSLQMQGSVTLSSESVAQSEVQVASAVLKYGRFARGGRIIHPAEQLSSYLDRRPQLLDPKLILERVGAADAPDAALRALHPQHAQFEQLRQAYLAAIAKESRGTKGPRAGGENSDAKRILANMEQWRWMPADLGAFYVWNNVPEYIQRVVKASEVIQTERIVAGELGKQTPIFSRPMRRVTFKPTWKVPDSIKANEIWPSLLRGGGLMTSWALQLQTKEGQIVDWRKIDWSKTDILNYDVIQVTGPQNVLGKVKFSFPNPHTVFMHDTLARDKYMFNVGQRTFSHGCMRVRNPMRLAEALLAYDKGWSAQQVNEAYSAGPLNNEIALDQKIPVHTTYFTAWVGADGKLQTARDSYGHERRITLALEGKWSQINKGRDHLAPVSVNLAAASAQKRVGADGEPVAEARTKAATTNRSRGAIPRTAGNDFFGSLFGGF